MDSFSMVSVTPLETLLFEKTRETKILVRTVGLILVCGALIAWIFSYIGGHAGTEPYFIGDQNDEEITQGNLREWQNFIDDPDLEFWELLRQMPEMVSDSDPEFLEKAKLALREKEFQRDEKRIVEAVFDSLTQRKIEPNKALKDLARREPPVRYAEEGLGVVLYQADEGVLSARAFEKEGLFPDAEEARKAAVKIYGEENRLSDLRRLLADPVYEKLIDHGIRIRLASDNRDWLGVWKNLLQSQYESVRPQIVLMALLSGIVWLTISCRLLQLDTLKSRSFVLCLAGFLLGIASTWPTVFAYIWIDEVTGMKETNDVLNNIFYNIFVVGLTEESIKLLCFCPLIPFLLKRDNQLEILIVAGCVGLGFAAEENIMYFDDGTDAAIYRFVTANFLHISATGLCGLALCRAISDPVGHGGIFLKWFAGVIAVHGVYDYLLGDVPILGDTEIGAMACYIALCYIFFAQAHGLRTHHRQIIGLNFIFLNGLALLVALAMVDLSLSNGFQQGMSMIVMQLLGACIIAFLFVREFSKG